MTSLSLTDLRVGERKAIPYGKLVMYEIKDGTIIVGNIQTLIVDPDYTVGRIKDLQHVYLTHGDHKGPLRLKFRYMDFVDRGLDKMERSEVLIDIHNGLIDMGYKIHTQIPAKGYDPRLDEGLRWASPFNITRGFLSSVQDRSFGQMDLGNLLRFTMTRKKYIKQRLDQKSHSIIGHWQVGTEEGLFQLFFTTDLVSMYSRITKGSFEAVNAELKMEFMRRWPFFDESTVTFMIFPQTFIKTGYEMVTGLPYHEVDHGVKSIQS